MGSVSLAPVLWPQFKADKDLCCPPQAVNCSLQEREARSMAEPEVRSTLQCPHFMLQHTSSDHLCATFQFAVQVNAMQRELRDAEVALEEIAACVRDAQPETPNAGCMTYKRQPAGAQLCASWIAEDARRVLATLKRERERLTAEAASLLDELMQARVSGLRVHLSWRARGTSTRPSSLVDSAQCSCRSRGHCWKATSTAASWTSSGRSGSCSRPSLRPDKRPHSC